MGEIHPRTTLVVGSVDVRRLVPMRDCLPVLRRTMQAVSRGEAVLPLRIGSSAPGGAVAAVAMPGWIGGPAALGAKLISVTRDGGARGSSSHQGIVVLFDEADGTPVGIVDATSVTALRTAAASAVATDALARDDAKTLAILGTGEQAREHLDALVLVRRIRDVRMWGRTREHAEALATEASARLGLHIRVAGSVREAVDGADIVATTTAARDPILEGAWLAPGTHVNLVGASGRAAREVDDAVVTRARFFVDYRASALAQAGELLHAKGDDAAAFIAGEIGEVLSGKVAGRTGAEQITVYKSLGIAAQDLALATEVLARARAAGAGTPVVL